MIRLYRFALLPNWRRTLLIEAALQLLVARIELLVSPFQRIARRLGVTVPQDAAALAPSKSPQRHEPALPEQEAAAVKVGWAVRVAARNLPFEAVCLPQAIAAKRMLARRQVGSVLHFGVGREQPDASLSAHAWVDVAGIPVTGYPVAPRFKEVARFS